MPSLYTFSVAPIAELLAQEKANTGWADPFAGKYSPAEITNDDKEPSARFHLDGLEFLKTQSNQSLEGVIFDPPYSVEQALRFYKPKHGGTAGRAEYWARCKDEISRSVRTTGKAICFGWDSTGIGKSRGFRLDRVLLVCHGACHNDTIITVETKVKHITMAEQRTEENLPF